MKNIGIIDRGGYLTITISDAWESKEISFHASDVESISRDWSTVNINFNNGTKKRVELTFQSDAINFECRLRNAIDPYRYRHNVVTERVTRYVPGNSDMTVAAVGAGVVAVAAAAASIIDRLCNKKSNKHR